MPDVERRSPSIPSTPSLQPLVTIPNLSGKQLSQSYNSGTSGKSSLTVGLSSQSNPYSSLSKTSRYD